MKNLYKIVVALALSSGSQLMAQQMPFSSHYFINPFLYNPAYTGNSEQMNVYLSHRSQFTGIAGSPQTSYIALNGPINIKGIGLGLNAYSDVTSILSRNSVTGNYSYSLKLGSLKNSSISFGVAAGIIDQTINYQDAIVHDLDDPNLTNQRVRKTVFSADLGVLYKMDKLEAAFSMPQAIGNKVRFKENNGGASIYDLNQHFIGSLKYEFEVLPSQGIKAYPLVVMRGVKGAPFQYDISAVADWKKHGWFAVTYRSNYAVGISAGVRYKNLSVGYSHDFTVTKVRSYTGATHEFMLSYSFGNELKKQVEKHELEIQQLKESSMQQRDELTNLQTRVDSLETSVNELKQKETEKEQADLKANELKNAELKKDEEAALNAKNDSLNVSSGVSKLHTMRKLEVADSLITGDKTMQASNVEARNNDRVRTYKSSEFLDMEGKPMRIGYYVIIGSFGVKENASAYKNEVQKVKGTTASIIFNKSTGISNIYILYSEDYPTADNERKLWKAEFENAWVLNLE